MDKNAPLVRLTKTQLFIASIILMLLKHIIDENENPTHNNSENVKESKLPTMESRSNNATGDIRKRRIPNERQDAENDMGAV